MSWARIIGAGALLFGGIAFGSFKYNQAKYFEDELNRNQSNLKTFLWTIHQKMALNLDNILEKYEKGTRIGEYRKVLLSYAKGLVLETGVGTSRNIKYYPANCEVIGIDWAPNMLEVAMIKPKALADIDYKLDDVEKLSFKDDVFDTVVDTFGLEYYVDPERALNEIKRVCKKDGNILILTSGLSQYDYLNLLLNFKAPATICNSGYFPNRDWTKLITPDKFEIVSQQRLMNGTIYFYVLKNKK